MTLRCEAVPGHRGRLAPASDVWNLLTRTRACGAVVACYLLAALLSLGAGLGVTSAVRSSAASQIPSPPAKNQTFEEDFNGIGQDNQANAVLVSAPGVVSVQAAGKPVACGVVITSKLSDGKYPAVKLGNSDDIHLEDTVNNAGAPGSTRGLVLSTGEITGINLPAVVGGHRLTGLIRVSSLDRPAEETGGPLLTLNAEVLGIAIGAGRDRRTATAT